MTKTDGRQAYKILKRPGVPLTVIPWLLVVLILLLPGYCAAGDLSFLSYDQQEMITFDLYFKQYIASFKGQHVNRDEGLKSLASAIQSLEGMIKKARTRRAGPSVLGRLGVIHGLLYQAQGLALQARLPESREVSVPIRSEIYDLHKALRMLTAEDQMVLFHNGVLHRAEPLIAEGRYMELAMLVPLIEDTLAKFEAPPRAVADKAQYRKRFRTLVAKVEAYTAAIREANNCVDPEYGAFRLNELLRNAHADVHKAFGAVYLSFPESP